MKRRFFIILVLIFFISNNFALAYDTYTHSYLTKQAVELYNQNFPDKQISKELIPYLLEGAQREDDPPRWMNHFYDPVYNRGYEVDFRIDNTLPYYFIRIVTDLGSWLSSKDWANSTSEQNKLVYKANFYHAASVLNQNEKSKLSEYYYDTNFTYKAAKNLWFQGEKEKAMFALGHILHLIEDSAVPDHTRDDGHIGDSPYESFTKKYNLNNPDTKLQENLKNQKPVILSDLNSYFESLANYSNSNFYSKDTIGIQSGYKNPEPISQIIQNDVYYVVKLDENGNNLILAQNKRPQGLLISNSLFLDLTDEQHLVLSEYWNHLAPKAVAYSAGVINLFFNETENQVALEPEEKPWYSDLFGTILSLIDTIGQGINSIFSNQFSDNFSINNETILISPSPSALVSLKPSPLVSISPDLKNQNSLLTSPIINSLPTPSFKPTIIPTIKPTFVPSPTPINSIIPTPQLDTLAIKPDGPRPNLEVSPTPSLLPNPTLISTPIPNPEFIIISTSTPTSTPEITPTSTSTPTSTLTSTNPYFNNVKVYFDDSSYQEEGGVLTIEFEINKLIEEFDIHNFVIGFNSEFIKSDGYCYYYRVPYSMPSVIAPNILLKHQLPYTAILENSQHNRHCSHSAYCLTDLKNVQLPIKVKIQPNYSSIQNGSIVFNVYTKQFLEQILGREINYSDFITIAYNPTLEGSKLGSSDRDSQCFANKLNNKEFSYYNNLFPKPDNTHYYLLETNELRSDIPYPSPYPVSSIVDLHWGKNASSSTGYSLEIKYQLPILNHLNPNESGFNSFIWYFALNNSIPYGVSCKDSTLNNCSFNYVKSYETENNFLNLLYFYQGYNWGGNGLKFCFDSEYACYSYDFNWGSINQNFLPHYQHPSTTPYILRFDIEHPNGISFKQGDYLTVSNWQYAYNSDRTDLNFHLREPDSRKWYFEENFVSWQEPSPTPTPELTPSPSPSPSPSPTPESIPISSSTPSLNLEPATTTETTSTSTATSTSTSTSTSTPTSTSTATSTLTATTSETAKLEVVINEIAWMGTKASHNDEWIELYNNTKGTIDLNGWVLKSISGSPSITLSNTISANGFYVLERTSSTTISNIDEDQIFTGVLNNVCEVLELIDNSGNLQDKTICNGNNWPAGKNQTGENIIRASMERINPNISGESLSNWCTYNKNDGAGLDATNSNPILGTPKAPNSCYLNSG